jgi:ferredoxin
LTDDRFSSFVVHSKADGSEQMLKVDVVKCTGCGTCMETCPVEAITLLSGKAVIDNEVCNTCGECVQVCPDEAIFSLDVPIPAEVVPSSPISVHQDLPPAVPLSQKINPWVGMMLSLLSRELLPRFADSLVLALERRLESPMQTIPNHYLHEVRRGMGTRRRQRRCAGRKGRFQASNQRIEEAEN